MYTLISDPVSMDDSAIGADWYNYYVGTVICIIWSLPDAME